MTMMASGVDDVYGGAGTSRIVLRTELQRGLGRTMHGRAFCGALLCAMRTQSASSLLRTRGFLHLSEPDSHATCRCSPQSGTFCPRWQPQDRYLLHVQSSRTCSCTTHDKPTSLTGPTGLNVLYSNPGIRKGIFLRLHVNDTNKG